MSCSVSPLAWAEARHNAGVSSSAGTCRMRRPLACSTARWASAGVIWLGARCARLAMSASSAACSSASARSQWGTSHKGTPARTACRACSGVSRQPHNTGAVGCARGWLQRSSRASQVGSPAYSSRASSRASRVMQWGGICTATSTPRRSRASSRAGVCKAAGTWASAAGWACRAASTMASSSHAAGTWPRACGWFSTAASHAARVVGASVFSASSAVFSKGAAVCASTASRACCAASRASTLGAAINHSDHQAPLSSAPVCG